jgi:3-oxoacyl-[acyl-carrier-protein] synthase III
MRIVSLAAVQPSNDFDNSGYLDLIDRNLAETGMADGERSHAIERLARIYDKAGSSHRRMEPTPHRGHSMDLLRHAALQALAEASRMPEDVDLIIYCSVARGWMEPSSAAAAQAAIGAVNASCFDVLEACAGWMRAVEIADALMRSGRYGNALIVGVEAGMREVAIPRAGGFHLHDEHLAAFTIGESATAMLVEHDEAPPPEIDIRSDGRLHEVCMIPLPMAESFLLSEGPSPDPIRFVSHSERLFPAVMTPLIPLMRKRLAAPDAASIALFIPHAASGKASEAVRKALGIPAEKFLCGHARFGNTVSMAMPTVLDFARRSGRIKPGDRVCFLVASAGISYGYGILTC